MKIVGAGATGNGVVGQYPRSPHRGELRRAYSRVISADERWLRLRFDPPPKAVALEGTSAAGDSGAPVFIEVNGKWEVAGLVSHKFANGKLQDSCCCQYGQVTYHVRVWRYATWMDSIISKN